MAWFSKKQPVDPSFDPEAPVEDDDHKRPLRPLAKDLLPEHAARVRDTLAQLEAEHLDVTDLQAISNRFDQACREWHATPAKKRGDEMALRDPIAIALGEYLVHTTDLEWVTVHDVFGTDLGLMGTATGDDFSLVPDNLIQGRWQNNETGWIPGVVKHLVRIRQN